MCLAHRRGCCECRRELQMRESGVQAGSEGPRLHMQGRGRRGGGSDGSGGGGDGEVGSEGIRTAETAWAKERRERGRWGSESRGGTAVAADCSVAVVVEGAEQLWGQRAGWQVKEQVGGGRMWHVSRGRENVGDGGDRRQDAGAESVGKGGKEWEGERAAARVQRVAEDSEGVGTGGKITAGAESGVAAGQRAWGRGWEREERAGV